MKKIKFSILGLFAVVSLTFAFSSAMAAGLTYFQGFEVDTYDWSNATRVASATNNIVSASGSWHAEAATGAFTRWGGYNSTFPDNGYVTSVDVWLEASSTSFANDKRFDFSSAINTPAGTHRRDFVFNAGFYSDTDATGTGPRFVISASNNSGRGNAFPKNPARGPFTITEDGWYTFEHTFRNIGGVLSADLKIKDAAGVVLNSWTLSDATDVIPSTVGGNRYGWFVIQELPVLAIDNASKFDIKGLATDKEQCKKGGWSQFVNGAGEDFQNQGKCVRFVTTGN